MMALYKVTHDGKPILVNGDNVLTISYDEEPQQLTIKFVNGDILTLNGDSAADAWRFFCYEILNDAVESGDGEVSGSNGSSETGGTDDDDEDDDDPFESINRDIALLERQMQRELVTRTYEANLLRRYADDLDEYWKPKKKRELKSQLKEVRARAYAVADAAEAQALANTVNQCLTAQIVNTQSAKVLLRDLDEAEDTLRKTDRLTDELSQNIRRARERVAWNRAKKKLDDASVAAASGNQKKSDKLRLEAETMLKQDWATVFQDEDPPALESANNSR
jgi:hypothetical protein